MLKRRLPAVAIALVVALTGLVPQFLSRTLPDIAFLLYAAGRVLDGGRLYVDVIEINPPLIVWLNIPVVIAASALGISEILAYRLAIVALSVVAVVACRWMLLRTEEGASDNFRRPFLVAIIFALFVLPRLDWGEREHLTLALILPYLLLAVVRMQRRAVGPTVAVVTGIAAAIGIAIKPQFALLWAARELVVAVGVRRPSLEGMVIVACGGLYLGAVALFAPEYFTLVRELGPAYRVYQHNSLAVTALLADGAAITLGAMLVVAGLWRRGTAPELRMALLAATLTCYVVAVIQLKGWRYHFYPALTLGWLLLAVSALRTARPLARWTDRLFAAIAGTAVLTVALLALAGAMVQTANPRHPRYDADPSVGPLLEAIGTRLEGRPLMMFSSNMASGFPLTTYLGADWPQRYSNLWPLVAAYDSALQSPLPFRYRNAREMTELERALLQTVTEDFVRSRPPLVAVLRPGPDEPKWWMRRLDLLAFLRRDGRFAQLFDRYVPAGEVGQYHLFRDPEAESPLAGGTRPSPVPGAEEAPGQVRIQPEGIAGAVLFLMLLAAFYTAERRHFMAPIRHPEVARERA